MPSASAEVSRRISYVLDGLRTPATTILYGEAAVMQLLRAPSLTFLEYVQRLIEYAYCTPECFIIACVYTMDIIASGALPFTECTAHRVYAASLLLAIKTRDDNAYRMAYYAQVLGIPTAELVLMERFVLKALDFRTHVDPKDYALVIEALVEVDADGDTTWQHHLVSVPVTTVLPAIARRRSSTASNASLS